MLFWKFNLSLKHICVAPNEISVLLWAWWLGLLCTAEHFAYQVQVTADLQREIICLVMEWLIYYPNKLEGTELVVILLLVIRRSFAQIIAIHSLINLDSEPANYAPPSPPPVPNVLVSMNFIVTFAPPAISVLNVFTYKSRSAACVKANFLCSRRGSVYMA